jgi:hypothetical protein
MISKPLANYWAHCLRCAGVDKNLLIEMNDSGMSFNEIADYLDRFGSSSKAW